MTDELSSASVEVTQAEVTPAQESVAEVASEPVAETSTQPETTETKQEKQERLLSEKEVRRIAAKEKRDGYEKGRQEALAEIERQRQEQAQQPVDPAYETEDQRISRMVEAKVEAKLAKKVEDFKHKENLARAAQIEKNFLSKIDDARDRYPDFDEKYQALQIEQHPKLVLWMDGLDNVGDIVYEMANNPEKVASVMMLANSGFESLAKQKLKSISDSIRANESAKKQPQAPDPLTQVKPTSVGIDSGFNTVSDFRKAPWLRG